MNKKRIIEAIIQRLIADVAVCEMAVAMARDTATHRDCLGSSKYETMGTEASYLAQGQGHRLLELERTLAYFKQLQLPTRPATIGLGSLVGLENTEKNAAFYLIALHAGGLTITLDDTTIHIITPQAPLGRALLGKSSGDTITLHISGNTRYAEVVSLI